MIAHPVLAGLILIAISLPTVLQGLRTGRLHARGPHGRVERRLRPGAFWSSISVMVAIAIGGLALMLWGLFQDPL